MFNEEPLLRSFIVDASFKEILPTDSRIIRVNIWIFLMQYALGMSDCAVFLHVNRDRFIFDSDMH